MHDQVKTAGELTRGSLLVTLGATIGLMTSSPSLIATTLGLFLAPVTQAFHIGRGTFGLMTGAALLVTAALTPFVGQAMDRYGVRRLVLPGVAALAVVQLLLAIVPVSTPLLVVLLLLQGAAGALLTPLAYTKVLSLWFHRRRGQMLGIASAIGIGGGTGVAAGLVGALLHQGGWRLAYGGLGVYLLVVGGLAAALLLREPPGVVRTTKSTVPADLLPGLSQREALGTGALRLVMLMTVTSIGGITIMFGHAPALLAARGLNIGPAFVGCVALGSLIGQIASGFLLDRIDSPKVGAIFAFGALVGAAVVLHLGSSAAIALPGGVVMGLGQGAETGLAAYYVSRFCGLRAYTAISGLLFALVMVSAGIFPALAGFMYDLSKSYAAVIPLVDVLFAVATVSILLLPKYRFAAVAPRALRLSSAAMTPAVSS